MSCKRSQRRESAVGIRVIGRSGMTCCLHLPLMPREATPARLLQIRAELTDGIFSIGRRCGTGVDRGARVRQVDPEYQRPWKAETMIYATDCL